MFAIGLSLQPWWSVAAAPLTGWCVVSAAHADARRRRCALRPAYRDVLEAPQPSGGTGGLIVPAVSLDAVDAAELAELLRFVGDWLAADHDHLDASLRRFVGVAGYDVDQLRHALNRFTFLLGDDDGEALFTPDQ